MNIQPRKILPAIVFSQFAGTSIWFAGNAILGDLIMEFDLPESSIGLMTSSVQIGFIVGTLIFAVLNIADRFSARKVFLISSILGALSNCGIIFSEELFILLLSRFFSGFFLAGIYPVGMKIAAGWYKEGLGKSLGYLVGALVLGTAFPHLLKGFASGLEWRNIIIYTSLLAVFGGLIMMFLVPNGPYHNKGGRINILMAYKVFQNKRFRMAAFGYFGHMWELYAFWAFTPILISYYNNINSTELSESGWSFFIIGIGTLGCILGGFASQKFGSIKIAFAALLISGLCCLISPFIYSLSPFVFLTILLIWGFTVVADSPQFSALTAKSAPNEFVGTGLTIVTSIGFFITVPSIQLLSYLSSEWQLQYILLPLAIGPLIGLISVRKLF